MIFHFFASSVGEFRVDTDIRKLTKYMDRRSLEYAIWYVPVAINDEYEISAFQPMVEGTVYLGMYQPNRPKK